MDVANVTEEPIVETTGRHIPEAINIHNHSREKHEMLSFSAPHLLRLIPHLVVFSSC
jgi:hypothetical protein